MAAPINQSNYRLFAHYDAEKTAQADKLGPKQKYGLKINANMNKLQLFFAKLFGWAVVVEVNGKAYAVGRKSLEHFLARHKADFPSDRPKGMSKYDHLVKQFCNIVTSDKLEKSRKEESISIKGDAKLKELYTGLAEGKVKMYHIKLSDGDKNKIRDSAKLILETQMSLLDNDEIPSSVKVVERPQDPKVDEAVKTVVGQIVPLTTPPQADQIGEPVVGQTLSGPQAGPWEKLGGTIRRSAEQAEAAPKEKPAAEAPKAEISGAKKGKKGKAAKKQAQQPTAELGSKGFKSSEVSHENIIEGERGSRTRKPPERLGQ